MVMVRVPVVQSALGTAVASAISDKFGTPVSVGRVDVGIFNRIIIDDVAMLDKRGKRLLWASRLSAKFSYTDLARGRVTITSAQVFTPKLNLYKENAAAKPNFQFVLDSLASKDTTHKSRLNLAINSLIIRHGQVAWNQWDKPRQKTFDINHLNISEISSHIVFDIVDGNTYHAFLKKLSLREASGVDIRSLSFKAEATKSSVAIENLSLAMPGTEIVVPHVEAVNDRASRSFTITLAKSRVTPCDFRAFLPALASVNRPVLVKLSARGRGKRVSLTQLEVAMPRYAGFRDFSKLSDLRLSAMGWLTTGKPMKWHADVRQFHANANVVRYFAGKVPDVVTRLGDIAFYGTASGSGQNINAKGKLRTSAGVAVIDLNKKGQHVGGHVATEAFNLRDALANQHFGIGHFHDLS